MEDKKQKLIEIVRGAARGTSRRKPAKPAPAVRTYVAQKKPA